MFDGHNSPTISPRLGSPTLTVDGRRYKYTQKSNYRYKYSYRCTGSNQEQPAVFSTKMSSSNDTAMEQALDAAVNRVLQSNFDAESIVCLTTILKVLDNVIKQPANPKVRTLRSSNPTIQQKIIQKQGLGILLACGFQEVNGEITLPLQVQVDSVSEETTGTSTSICTDRFIQQVRQRIHHVLSQELKVKDLPTMPTPPPSVPPVSFDVYQPQRFDGPSVASGTNLSAPQGWKSQTELQLKVLQQKQEKLEKKITKTDRHWKAFRSASISTSVPISSSLSPGDGISSSDSALLAAQIAKQQQERQAAENRGFTTKAMRDLEALKKSKVYSHAHLRIHFADGSIVAGNFGPREKCVDIIDALRKDVFVETVSTIPLELYMTPPRIILDTQKSLQELQLVPAAKIHVKWNQPLPGGSNESGWFVQPHLFQEKPTVDMPQAIAVVDADKEEPGGDPKPTTGTNTAVKRKMTKAEKEAALLKRMMG